MPVGWGCVVTGAEACWQGQKAIELCDNGEPKPVGRGGEEVCDDGEPKPVGMGGDGVCDNGPYVLAGACRAVAHWHALEFACEPKPVGRGGDGECDNGEPRPVGNCSRHLCDLAGAVY